ncbi:hypothetical protein DVH24_015915 [Malus domestica]|uniref:Uncharacterized protein n=1 Tax=Malus domestica TaxID=3750 RepID=A0A498JDS0_MALDO|nr:hypothetical protein DVH24_015915 [Malus domestica]
MCGDGEQLKRGQRQDMEVVLEKRDDVDWAYRGERAANVVLASSLLYMWVFSSVFLFSLPFELFLTLWHATLGESVTEVAQDALAAEYGQEKNMTGL